MVRLRLIGQMEAWTLTSENVLPPGRKTRALLAVVALSAPRPALRGRLAELLWSRRPEEQARASLRQEIHRLLEIAVPGGHRDILMVTRDHLSLRPGVVWVDVDEVMRATVEQPASLSLLDGDLLEDLDGIDPTFDAWLAAERERLRDKARSVAEALLREQVEPEAAIPVAQRLLSIDRAHEGAWRALMRAHAARGERGMAIQAYDRCRAVLADLLDAAPSAGDPEAAGGDSRPVGQPHPPAPARATAGRGRADEPSARSWSRDRRSAAPAARRRPCRRDAAAARRHHGGGGASRDRPRRGDHHGAGPVPLDVRGVLQLARPLRRRDARRDGDPPHLRHRLPAGRHDPAGAQRACASRCACSTCARATRWCGRAGSTASRTTCCRCRTRSPPRSWRRSIRRSC